MQVDIKKRNQNNMLKKCVLKRYEFSDEGTFGRLVTPFDTYYYSLELPDKENKQNISCIPKGNYICTFSPFGIKGTHHYLLLNVPNRTEIFIHSGNFAGDKEKGLHSDIEGCILLGGAVGQMVNPEGKTQKSLMSSHSAVDKFEAEMEYKDFILEIA